MNEIIIHGIFGLIFGFVLQRTYSKYKESKHYKKRQNLKVIRKKMGEWGKAIQDKA